ncbi:hypothetical protein MHU86_18149 [Fragilaria crotonensis]|nr:hypothetical protein MHU86_18149 [Fragilaria crotonensis]
MGDERSTNFECASSTSRQLWRTPRPGRSRPPTSEIAKVGIVKDKKKKPSRRLKPFEKAKVKQLREAKKKEKKEKSEARSVAAVTTQEDAPPDNEGRRPLSSNAGKQFGRAAHVEQQKPA